MRVIVFRVNSSTGIMICDTLINFLFDAYTLETKEEKKFWSKHLHLKKLPTTFVLTILFHYSSVEAVPEIPEFIVVVRILIE